MDKRHPRGRGGENEQYEWKIVRKTFGSEESSIPSLARAKMDFSLLHFVGNISLPPCKVSQEVEAQVAAGGTKVCRGFLPIPRQVENRQAGLDFLQSRASLMPGFPITAGLVLNPLAPTLPMNFGGTALWLLEGCLCAPDGRGRWQS